jgi:hypothetical protein
MWGFQYQHFPPGHVFGGIRLAPLDYFLFELSAPQYEPAPNYPNIQVFSDG